MSALSDAISKSVKKTTKEWKAEKRKADKNDNLHSYQYQKFYVYSDRVTIRDVAFDVMEAAYNHASSNGKYYANARQIMYAARPEILRQTGRKELLSATFQTLLKDYIEEREPAWKIVWDARGHLIEPHTNKMIGLGGREVDKYIKDWNSAINMSAPEIETLMDTKGPHIRYKNVLFTEKEGFNEILSDAGFPERYDMALMSTKGLSNKAACDLIYHMDLQGVRVFVLHDFDLAGFKILRTLKEGVRLSVGTDVSDFGLRMADIKNLPSEPVTYKQRNSPIPYLIECGCTGEEIAFLVRHKGDYYSYYSGDRVELNAMTSEQLISWLEGKLLEYGVEKFIPDQETLKKGYAWAKKMTHVKELIKIAEKSWDESMKEDPKAFPPPKNLQELVNEKLKDTPSRSWDQSMWDIINDEKQRFEREYGSDEKG